MKIRDGLIGVKDYVVREYRGGRGTPSLGRELGCNSATVYLMLREWGEVDPGRSLSPKHGDDSFDALIVDLHSRGKSAYAISKEVGLSRPCVIRRGGKLGLSFSKHSKLKNPVRLKDRAAEALALFDSGCSAMEIGRRLGYSQPKVCDLLRKLGRDVRRNRYDVDLHFFDEVDSEEKAYALGFWYADGNNRGDGIRMCLADEDMIHWFKGVLRYTGPVTYKSPRKEGRKPQYEIFIARRGLSDALRSKGCPERKSLTLTFPGPDVVPASLLRHFARGYFDGDGSIGGCRGKWRVQIVGTREFLRGLSEASGVPGYWSQRHPGRKKNNWNWSVGKRDDLRRFLDWIYEGSTARMGRKYERYLSYLAGESAPRRKKATPPV